MKERIARQKSLFTVPASSEAAPSLRGGRCSCGYVFFPPHSFGCESCGAGPEAITIAELATRGVLKSFALAHQQGRLMGTEPLFVGEVLLDDGPAISVVLRAKDEKELSIGQRVHGVLVPGEETSEGQVMVDCLFAPEGDLS